MIIDVHTHTPQYREPVPPDRIEINRVWRPDRAVQATVSWQDYMEAMAGVDRAIVFGIAWHPGDTSGGVTGSRAEQRHEGNLNDATAAFVRAYPDKLIGFMSVHPYDRKALDELERCRTDLGLRGIKIGANYQNFDPLDDRALAIYQRAEALGLPIMFHMGTSPVAAAPIRYSHPLVMDQVAIRYPRLKAIMAHMGHPWQVDTCVVIRKHPNLYADVSALFYRPFSFYEAMRKATEWNVLDKLLFGTDYPVTTPAESLDALRRVNQILEGTKLPRVPEEVIEAIIQRNSLELLGLT
jgi:predicted TIM-barrel fold metal-dependent hydrolase